MTSRFRLLRFDTGFRWVLEDATGRPYLIGAARSSLQETLSAIDRARIEGLRDDRYERSATGFQLIDEHGGLLGGRAAVDGDTGPETMIAWVRDHVATALVVVDGEPEV